MQLALVPTLFLLPPWLVPVAMAAGIVASRVPDVVRGRTAARPPAGRRPATPGSRSGRPPCRARRHARPGARQASLLLVAMLAAQIGTDFGDLHAVATAARRARRVTEQLREAYEVYVVDIALAPVGLLAALAIDESPWYLTLMIPLFGVLAVFASRAAHAPRAAHRAQRRLPRHRAWCSPRSSTRTTPTRAGTRAASSSSRSPSPTSSDWTTEHRRNVEFGALLHDVGKVAIPNEILNKPGPLDDAEWRVMRTHTIEGQRMLDSVGGFMSEVGAIVRGSHERWDGGGYPDGLAGADDPARGADRLLLRRLQRDDDHAPVPRGDARRGLRPRNWCAAPARSSIPTDRRRAARRSSAWPRADERPLAA